jgi:hypothetical protein
MVFEEDASPVMRLFKVEETHICLSRSIPSLTTSGVGLIEGILARSLSSFLLSISNIADLVGSFGSLVLEFTIGVTYN